MYVLRTETLETNGYGDPIQYFELSKDQINAIKAYISNRPDRFLAKTYWPEGVYDSYNLEIPADYWPDFYKGTGPIGEKFVDFNKKRVL